MSATIPVANLYYLLCYAWDKLDERGIVDVDPLASTELVDLFARVLVSGTNHLIKRGFDRGYFCDADWTPAVRGRILFNERCRRPGPSARLPCEFDELSHDVLHNQILKTTLRRLSQVKTLPHATAESLDRVCRWLSDVREIELDSQSFKRVRLNRNNHFYDFLLRVCQIVYENWLPAEGGQTSRFRDFDRDDKQMAKLYEAFVRNFYIRHSGYLTRRENIEWNWTTEDSLSAQLLPQMQTDVSLRRDGRRIVVECKYTPNATQFHYDTEKLRSEHLYQVFAYVSNLSPPSEGEDCELILLYPESSKALGAVYRHKGWIIRVCTIDLNQSWQGIHDQLLGLVA